MSSFPVKRPSDESSKLNDCSGKLICLYLILYVIYLYYSYIILTMKEELKERIDEDYMYLSVCMKKEIKRLVRFLADQDNNTLNPEEEEDIMDEASDTLKAQTLLDYLINKEDKAFDDFYDGALHSHMWKAADILKPEKGPHQPKEEDIEEFLPDNWPTESHFEVIRNPHNISVKKVGPTHTRIMGYFEDSAKHGVYNMTQKVKGRVLMILNTKFDNLPARPGSLFDRAGLEHLFSQLGFEIDLEREKTTKEMWDILKHRASLDHTNYNSFVLILLSYGIDNKYVFGKDGPTDPIDIEKIKELFSTQKQLVNKPKVFIIEAPSTSYYSREAMSGMEMYRASEPRIEPHIPGLAGRRKKEGLMRDGLHPHDDMFSNNPSGTDMPDGIVSLDDVMAKMEMPQISLDREMAMMDIDFDGLLDADGPDSKSEQSAPARSDIFQAIATSGEMLMHHDDQVGSWFIQAFIYTTACYAHQCDLQTLIEKVNTLVRSQNEFKYSSRPFFEIEDKRKQLQQVCSSISTLNKKLYFFPGLPIES